MYKFLLCWRYLRTRYIALASIIRVMLGVDEATYSSVSDFGQYLQHPDNRKKLDFKLKNGGYDTTDHQATDASKVQPRHDMQIAGWEIRRRKARFSSRVEVADGAIDNPFTAPKKSTGDAAKGNAA